MRTPYLFSGLWVIRAARSLIGLFLVGLFFGLPNASAEDTDRTFKLALLSPSPPFPRFSRLMLDTLAGLGYVEGKNLVFLERWAGGSEERLHRDAAELVELKVDLIYAGTSAAVRAAANATRTIPIIAVDMESDPVASGWVAGLARPGGNITGFFLDLPELSGKRLEQLKEVVPRLSMVAVLWDATLDRTPLSATETAARALGLRMVTLEVRRPEELEAAFKAAVKQRAQAVLMMQSPLLESSASQIAALAAKHRLPIAGIFPFLPDAGFLMSYGPDVEDLIRRCWVYADRILKGEKPGDLPIQRPGKFDLVLNLKTAKALGITFPQSLLIQSDRTIR